MQKKKIDLFPSKEIRNFLLERPFSSFLFLKKIVKLISQGVKESSDKNQSHYIGIQI